MCIRNGTRRVRGVPTWGLAIVAWAFLVATAVRADDGFATRVLFSFGAVETLRVGEADWEFARPGMALGPRDIVRMPPRALLRLGSVEGGRLELLTGAAEGSPADLLALAANSGAADKGVIAGPSDYHEVDVLPAGDLRETDDAPPNEVVFDAPTSAAWMDDRSHEHPVVRSLVDRVLSAPDATPAYMPDRLGAAHALFDAMTRDLAETSAFASLFQDRPVAPAFAFAALLAAADIPTRRHVDAAGRPFILLNAGVIADRMAGVTANRSLYRIRADGVVELPIGHAPGQTSFLQAWYAGDRLDPAAD